eukprot:1469065-Amphidinium_carterae.1
MSVLPCCVRVCLHGDGILEAITPIPSPCEGEKVLQGTPSQWTSPECSTSCHQSAWHRESLQARRMVCLSSCGLNDAIKREVRLAARN